MSGYDISAVADSVQFLLPIYWHSMSAGDTGSVSTLSYAQRHYRGYFMRDHELRGYF